MTYEEYKTKLIACTDEEGLEKVINEVIADKEITDEEYELLVDASYVIYGYIKRCANVPFIIKSAL